MSERYPRRALLRLREQERRQSQEALSDALSVADQARDAVERHELEVSAALEAVAEAKTQPTRQRASQAQLRGDYIKGLTATLQRLQERLAARQKELAVALQRSAEARELLADAERQLKAIEQDRDRWLAEQRRAAVERAEEELQAISVAKRLGEG